MNTIRMLGSEELTLKWYLIEPKIKESLAHGAGEVTPYSLLVECMSANAQCWVLEDPEGELKGVAITKYVAQVGYRELCIVVCTAKGFLGTHGKEILDHFEEFGRESDCKYVSILGRQGWRKFLPEEYVTPYQVYMRRL